MPARYCIVVCAGINLHYNLHHNCMMMFGLYMCPASICSRERLYTIRKQAIGRSAFNGVQGVKTFWDVTLDWHQTRMWHGRKSTNSFISNILCSLGTYVGVNLKHNTVHQGQESFRTY